MRLDYARWLRTRTSDAQHGYHLNYYKKTDSSQEIEFLFEKDGAAIPIEVKSKNGETESLNNFISEFEPPYAYKLVDGNVGVNGTKITLPQYMAAFL